MKKPNETALRRACLEYLQRTGFFAWINNTGAIRASYGGKERFVRFGAVGSPDIMAIMPGGGRFLGVECKMPGKHQTDSQRAWQVACEAHGGKYILANRLEDMIAGLRTP